LTWCEVVAGSSSSGLAMDTLDNKAAFCADTAAAFWTIECAAGLAVAVAVVATFPLLSREREKELAGSSASSERML
jgi:hypothetical protein